MTNYALKIAELGSLFWLVRIFFVYLQQIWTIMAQDIKDRYINPYTDFVFKKLFGTEKDHNGLFA